LRRNKALDPTALVGCPQASLLPSAVLAGQRRDWMGIGVSNPISVIAFRILLSIDNSSNVMVFYPLFIGLAGCGSGTEGHAPDIQGCTGHIC